MRVAVTSMLSGTNNRGSVARRFAWEPWLIWLAAVALQGGATAAAFNRFWYEEVAESIRNPFWLDQHTIYDGASSNIGWYGVCLVSYKLFGFSLAQAKLVRLVLHAISWACLLKLLRQALPGRGYILPALAIALSPTLLYFNTLQAQFAADLQYAPIVLWCLLHVSPKRPLRSTAMYTLAGIVTMLAAMSYPSVLVYLPFVLALVVWVHRRWHDKLAPWKSRLRFLPVIAAPLAGCALLGAGFLTLRQPELLLLDPHNHGGIFRGGGSQLAWDPHSIMEGVRTTLSDLFVKGQSYYFSLKGVEFGGWLGQLACALTIAAGLLLLLPRCRLRVPAAIAFALMFFCLVFVNLSSQYPGLRRCTAILFAFYALSALACVSAGRALRSRRLAQQRIASYTAWAAAALLVAHHALEYPALIDQLRQDSSSRDSWMQSAAGPDAALRQWAAKVETGDVLHCGRTEPGVLPSCRFSEFYAAVAGLEKWSRHREPKVVVIDPKTGHPVELSTRLWEDYYFQH
jgi:hypothetical protein